ncbi:MAG TPA: hypothetical protein VG123_39980 [Streptosporangiaceae bacterium]|nr:hypothetical protein [Streptosporangiaceae bacterium]
MSGAEVDDWYALLTARPGDTRWPRDIRARLAVLDEPGILFGVVSRMIGENARSPWYIEPICDRLPAASLRQLAGEAARARGDGDNKAAEAVIAYVSVQQPGALTAYLRALWDISRNQRSCYASWPWRAADDAEVSRLLEVAGDVSGPDAGFAVRCLLETRRPEVLARLPTDDAHLVMVGFGRDSNGELRRLHASAVWHLAFPQAILEKWASRYPLRRRQPSWPVHTGSGRQYLTSGFLDRACPKCGHRLHRLLRLDPVPAGIGITSRGQVEFAWCPRCQDFIDAGYARHAPDGAPEPFTLGGSSDLDRQPESFEHWFIPETPVGLVRLGERWEQQDWGQANDRENLHRVGGEPTWIQGADYPVCPGCTRTMSAAGQIAVADLWNFEGICYLLWCDPCAISAIVYQQT